MEIFVVLGGGGHTTEMLRLIDLLGDKYQYRYLVGNRDHLSAKIIRQPGPVHSVSFPRGTASRRIAFVGRSLSNCAKTTSLLLRHRPDAILSTGPSIALPLMAVAKTLGRKIIFVETGSRVRTVSITGRWAYRLADLYFVQWPQLQETMPKAVYAGRLL